MTAEPWVGGPDGVERGPGPARTRLTAAQERALLVEQRLLWEVIALVRCSASPPPAALVDAVLRVVRPGRRPVLPAPRRPPG